MFAKGLQDEGNRKSVNCVLARRGNRVTLLQQQPKRLSAFVFTIYFIVYFLPLSDVTDEMIILSFQIKE